MALTRFIPARQRNSKRLAGRSLAASTPQREAAGTDWLRSPPMPSASSKKPSSIVMEASPPDLTIDQIHARLTMGDKGN